MTGYSRRRRLRELRETAHTNTQRINVLAYKSIDSEARQRRKNLIFWGIPESPSEDPWTVLADFLSNYLELDPDNICVQRVHRMGKLNQPRRVGLNRSVTVRHRLLIAAFRDYQDVELILSNVKKLAGTTFGVNRDYPQEILNARKALMQEKKTIKSQKPSAKVSVQYPAKLVVDGHTVKDMFPDWFTVMKKSRLADSPQGRVRLDYDQVFDGSNRSAGGDSNLGELDEPEHLALARDLTSVISPLDISHGPAIQSLAANEQLHLPNDSTSDTHYEAPINPADESNAPAGRPPDEVTNQNT